jgi:hypothetical protein
MIALSSSEHQNIVANASVLTEVFECYYAQRFYVEALEIDDAFTLLAIYDFEDCAFYNLSHLNLNNAATLKQAKRATFMRFASRRDAFDYVASIMRQSL